MALTDDTDYLTLNQMDASLDLLELISVEVEEELQEDDDRQVCF